MIQASERDSSLLHMSMYDYIVKPFSLSEFNASRTIYYTIWSISNFCNVLEASEVSRSKDSISPVEWEVDSWVKVACFPKAALDIPRSPLLQTGPQYLRCLLARYPNGRKTQKHCMDRIWTECFCSQFHDSFVKMQPNKSHWEGSGQT